MKTISPALQTSLDQHVTSLCTCWLMRRTDGVQMGFTDHVKDIIYQGVVFKASSGYTRTAVASNAGLAVDNMDLEGAVRAAGITDDDIRAGIYDYAEVMVFLIDYVHPENGIIILRKGRIGELTLKDGIWVSEIRGLAQLLTRIFVEVISHTCQNQLGDRRCRFALNSYTDQGTITSIVTNRQGFTATFSVARADRFYQYGAVIFTSGQNAGRKAEVKSHTGSTIELLLPTAYPFVVGTTFMITAGCDKTGKTCRDKFNNLKNYSGFPHLPGLDNISLFYLVSEYGTGGGEMIAREWLFEDPSIFKDWLA